MTGTRLELPRPKTQDLRLLEGIEQRCPYCVGMLHHEGELTVSGGEITLKVYCFCDSRYELVVRHTDNGLWIQLEEIEQE